MTNLNGLKVFVYFNLHKRCWSVRHNGKVIAHLNKVCLKDVQFKVSKAGRERVLREKRKNVHAGVFGVITSYYEAQFFIDWHTVTYNPYKYDTFVTKTDAQPVYHSKIVTMDLTQSPDAKNVPLVMAHGI